MLVLLYSVCRSVSVRSCVDVIRSFTYIVCYVLLFGRGETAREKARGNANGPHGLSQIPSKEKKRMKQRLLAVALLLLLPTSNLLLPSTV